MIGFNKPHYFDDARFANICGSLFLCSLAMMCIQQPAVFAQKIVHFGNYSKDTPIETEISSIVEAAQEAVFKDQFSQAEKLYKKALILRLQNARTYSSRYVDTSQNTIVQGLCLSLARQKKYDKVVQILECSSVKSADKPNVDDAVADYLICQRKFGEARAILRKFVPMMKEPPKGGFCGTPYFDYEQKKNKLLKCEKMTPWLTELPMILLDHQRESLRRSITWEKVLAD